MAARASASALVSMRRTVPKARRKVRHCRAMAMRLDATISAVPPHRDQRIGLVASPAMASDGTWPAMPAAPWSMATSQGTTTTYSSTEPASIDSDTRRPTIMPAPISSTLGSKA